MTSSSQLLHVLIVDDENSFRLSMEMGLKMTNRFTVKSCDSGEEAMEFLKAEAFDVILMDNRMPDVTGLEVIEWMHKEGINTPVILITAASSEEIAVEALKQGVYDYLRKDQVDVGRLSIAINNVYERHLFRRQNIERTAEERLLKEKQKELDSLQTFHSTVNSVGELVEKSIGDLVEYVRKYKADMNKTVKDDARDEFLKVCGELEQHVSVISSGVRSMRDLSSVVTHKLDEIRILPEDQKR